MFSDLFPTPLIPIYFVYGLAFFTLGLAVALESRRPATEGLAFAQAMLPLAAFGLLHGFHEWLEMFIQDVILHGAANPPVWIDVVRVVMLAFSFAALLLFGIRMLRPTAPSFRADVIAAGGMLGFWLISVVFLGVIIRPGGAMRLTVESWLGMADTWGRYSLALPGSLISAYGLWRQAHHLVPDRRRYATDLRMAAIAFLLYGIVGQVFVNETYLFPSNVLNAALFERATGAPIQLFRAGMAALFAVTLIRALHMFELQRQEEFAAAQQRARDELAMREELRREMLRHTVAAQEEERRRIARELHDEIGQTLTALSLGLGSLGSAANGDPARLQGRIEDLRRMAMDGVAELHHLVADLRPSQLDHLGLVAALRSLAEEYRERFALDVSFDITGQRRRLPPNIELAVFRIAQEALTNVARHAKTQAAEVRLDFGADEIKLCICDQGIGFTLPEAPTHGGNGWGLLGMTERAVQLGGAVIIDSAPGQGTIVTVRLPLKAEF